MANPTIDEGSVKIANDLMLALIGAGLSSLELQTVLAIAYLTYGAGKSKAKMDLEDIRLVIGANKSLRKFRAEETFEKLVQKNIIYVQELPNGGTIIGIQKDYDSWILSTDAQNVQISSYIYKYNTNTTYLHKMCRPEDLAEFCYSFHPYKHTNLKAYKAEVARAKSMYRDALVQVQDSDEAYAICVDYINEAARDEFVLAKVKFVFAYLLPGFNQYLATLPKKPKRIREDEATTGYHYRWNVKTRHWEMSDARLPK